MNLKLVQGDPPAGLEFNDEEEATLGDIVILPDTQDVPAEVPEEEA